ncbi:MAG: GatB/YqeY domain-containing protein [Gammaproteobacteria bacterium]|nr:MAG: GatB/YqeY domain-containing protein [Gammaproteobacteria bacterium]
MPGKLKSRIEEDVRATMRARDKPRLGTLRMVTAAIKQREIDHQTTLDDIGVVSVLETMRKQRRDAHTQFVDAGRTDLAEQEAFEISIIESYLPEPLGEEELATLINAAVKDTGAAAMKDMGRVMGALKDTVQGRADMGQVSALVKARLT